MGISGELYNLLENSLSGRFHRVVLKRTNFIVEICFIWCSPRFHHGATSFSYHLPNELKSNVKLFADGTSLFAVVKDKIESANSQKYLKSIFTRVYNWKMLFDPDSSKPAQEVLLSRKKRKFKFIQP